MKIKNLSIRNYKSIQDLHLSCSPNINIIVGINGSGKSSVLQTIELLFSWVIARMKSTLGKGSSIAAQDINTHANYCFLEATLLHNDTKWSLYKQRPNIRYPQTKEKSDLSHITKYIYSLLEAYMDSPKTIQLPMIASYNVNRSVIDIPIRIHKKHELDPFSIYNNSLVGGVNFRSFFEWFREREDLENERARFDHDYTPDNQLEAVRNALKNVFPNYGELRVQRNPRGIVLKKENDLFRIDQLSDGEKCYLALIADIARRLAIINPHLSNPLSGSGIILIDEIELHLHPKWQSEVIEKLRTTFPNCQFFISTHSPHVVSNVYPNNEDTLLILENGQEIYSSIHPYGLNADQILTDIFQMTTVRNERVQQLIDSLWELLALQQYDTPIYKIKLEQLEGLITSSDIELIRIKAEQKKLEKKRT